MNETNVRNEILDSIDQVNAVTMESTMDVFNSLAASYDKAGMILEYSTSDDLDMFAIFQEAEAKEGDVSTDANAKKGGKQESLGMKILMFIPNILKKIWQFLKDAWNGIITPKAPAAKENKSLFEKILGKDADWINNHKVELGLSGAALASVIAFVTFMKKDAIANALSRWFGNIRKFFLAVKVAPKLAWNGRSFVTNIKLEGFVSTLKKLIEAVKSAQDAIKFIEDNAPNKKFSNIKDSLANWIKNVEEIKKAAESDPFILGEDVDLTGATLVDILNKMKELFTKGLPATAYDVNVEKLKALFENTEDSYVKEILGQLNNMKTALSLIGGIVMSSSELMKDTNTYATMVFDVQNKTDGSAPAEGEAKEDEKSEGEAKEEEKSEEPKEESKSAEIKDEKTAEAVEAVKEEPSKENATAAVEAIKENISKTDTGGDSAKSNATVAIKDGLDKVGAYLAKQPEISQMEAEKIAALALTVDALSEALSTQKLDKSAIQKYVDKAKKAEQSVLNVSPMKTKKGEKVVRNTQRGSNIVTGAELMEICKQLPNNPVVKINEDSIVLKTKKGKEDERTGNITIPGLSKLGYGKKNFVHKSGKGNTWIIESADDIFDVFNIYVESVLMSCVEDAEDTSFVVEYADGEVETVSEVIFESYDEPVETMEESINNHWYR